ncbi:MAG: hypothetical protein ACK5MV_08575 [Aminipila sp.]
MLKGFLSIFGFVGRATEAQTAASLKKLTSALERRLDNPDRYTVVFGYGMKPGIMSTKISCYAIGFSQQDNSLAIVPIYCDSDEIEDLYFFEREDIKSIATGVQGEKILKSDKIKGDIRFTVPGYTNENAEDMFQLPIIQLDAVTAFEKWIKEVF